MEESPEKLNRWIKQAQKGNVQAFGRIFDIYASSLYRFFFWRVRDKADAEDLVHEVFLSAWKSLPRYRKKAGAKFFSWLFTIARRRLVDFIRRRRTTVSWGKVGFADNPESQWHAAIDKEARFKAVMAAFTRLTSIEQEVLDLRFMGGLSVKETAGMLNLTEANVRQIAFRGINRLKKLLRVDE